MPEKKFELMLTSILTKLGLPLPERVFITLALLTIVVIRVGLIIVTPNFERLDDPQIYRGAGAAVLAGVNPYDFNDKVERRKALVQEAHRAEPSADFGKSLERWNYYVSSNFPASTGLYALFYVISGGSIFVLRLLFILGDISILFAFVSLIKVVRGGLSDAYLQAGIACVCVFYPALLFEGTVIPEDKQFQTALMLWSAALLIKVRRGHLRDVLTGGILSLAVLFKLFGVFLFPLWILRCLKSGMRFTALSALGGAIPVIASVTVFGLHFVRTMASRGTSESGSVAAYASPWALLPSIGSYLIAAKLVGVALFVAFLVWLLLRKRIDLLNFCAGLCVVFVTIWLSNGALNRVNVGLMFGMCCLVSLSVRHFFWVAAYAAFASGLIYAAGLNFMKAGGLLALEPVISLSLLVGYTVVLATLPSQVCSDEKPIAA